MFVASKRSAIVVNHYSASRGSSVPVNMVGCNFLKSEIPPTFDSLGATAHFTVALASWCAVRIPSLISIVCSYCASIIALINPSISVISSLGGPVDDPARFTFSPDMLTRLAMLLLFMLEMEMTIAKKKKLEDGRNNRIQIKGIGSEKRKDINVLATGTHRNQIQINITSNLRAGLNRG